MSRRIKIPRSPLGAMSWRVPDDDWDSPWSFEDEWLRPSASEVRRINATPGALDENPASWVSLPPATAAGIRRRDDVILRFDDEEPEEKPPVSVSSPPRKDKENEKPEPPVRPRTTASPETVTKFAEASPKTDRQSKAADSVEKSGPPVASVNVGLPPELPAQPEQSRPYKLEPLPQSEPAHFPTAEPLADKIESAPALPAKRLRRPSAFSWGSLISLGLGTLGFTLLAWVYLHDAPRESDEDLRPQVAVDQTPTTQAPIKLRSFLDSIIPADNVDHRRQPPWSWDTPSLSAFIRSNGTALDNLRDLLEDYDWHPHHSAWHRDDIAAHPGWAHAGYLLQAQAAYLARRGDEAPAFVAAIDLAEFSRRLQEVWAWPNYMRRALDLQFASVQLLSELLKSTHLNSTVLSRFQEEFIHCQPEDELLRQACAAYYIHEKKLLLGPASGELLDTMPGGQLHQRPGRLFFKMNETLGLLASAFRDLRDEIGKPPYTRLSVGSSASINLTAPRFYHPNSGGEAYFASRITPLLRLPEDHSLAKARHGLVRCLFGLRRYLADKHRLPENLQDMVPSYFAEVPQDPFSGESLFYDPSNGLLFSVGVNLVNEGGHVTHPPMNDDREPTVELGITIARPVKK